MIIIEDKAQQDKKHIAKHLYFEQNGIYWERYPLPVGDYIIEILLSTEEEKRE